MSETKYVLDCQYVNYTEQVWEQLGSTDLVDTVDGGDVQEASRIQTCWDDQYLYVRFDCVDLHTLANYTKRDDPLYEEDVVELFIDEDGNGTHYLELEFSPANVIFDAQIINHGDGELTVGLEWDAEGLETEVRTEGDQRTYIIKLPLIHFKQLPQHGTKVKANFYRIDHKPDGTIEHQAWSPTGVINFHTPSRFGTLQFIKD